MKYLIGIASVVLSVIANADMAPENIRAIREYVEYQKDVEATEKLSAEEKATRQASIDAEVTHHFKKRIQMRPSDVRKIDPACDEWLKLYKETGWRKAQEGIKQTCP